MPKIVMWYQTWHGGPLIARRAMDAVHRHGAIPMITWMPLVSPGRAASLAAIAAGNHDDYLRRSAADARAWGHRFLLRPFHEMNGRWSKWSVPADGTAQEFVAAWRHIVSVFRAEGATNVRFVFSPNVISRNSPTFTAMYPGDRYVDRVALDGYNWGTSTSGQSWRSFREVFSESYRVLAQLSTRPMLIGETASTEKGGDKAGWITHAFRRDMSQFPRIRAVVWFNHRKETSWAVDSSADALHAYRRIVRAE
jgi:beta-mannanase